MKKVINNVDNIEDWTFGGTIAENTIKEFTANGLDKSLVFKFDKDNTELTLNVPINHKVEKNHYVIFWAWSRNNKYYEVEFDNQDTFLLCPKTYRFNRFYLRNNITKFTIRQAFSEYGEDYLLLSSIMLVSDEFPLDILWGIKEAVNKLTDDKYLTFYKDKIMAGTDTLNLPEQEFLTRYSCLKFTDGNNTEYHQIITDDTEKITFSKLFDGRQFKNDFPEGADIYLHFPCRFGVWEKEIVIPSFSVWGFPFEQTHRNNELTADLKQYDSTGKIIGTLKEGAVQGYKILIDCESHSYELIAYMADKIKKLLDRKYVWINNQRSYIYLETTPVEITPSDDLPVLPKMQFSAVVEFRENVEDFNWFPGDSTIDNINIEIER